MFVLCVVFLFVVAHRLLNISMQYWQQFARFRPATDREAFDYFNNHEMKFWKLSYSLNMKSLNKGLGETINYKVCSSHVQLLYCGSFAVIIFSS